MKKLLGFIRTRQDMRLRKFCIRQTAMIWKNATPPATVPFYLVAERMFRWIRTGDVPTSSADQ